jgi:hypothetical protein
MGGGTFLLFGPTDFLKKIADKVAAKLSVSEAKK